MFKGNGFTIRITNAHIHFPNEWIFTVHELGITRRPLNLPAEAPIQEAQNEAEMFVYARLKKMLSSFE